MPYFRLYLLDRAGRFMRVEEMEATDDVAAMRRARELGHDWGLEVWQESRFVGMVGPAEKLA